VLELMVVLFNRHQALEGSLNYFTQGRVDVHCI
jgi:hypothetical protein